MPKLQQSYSSMYEREPKTGELAYQIWHDRIGRTLNWRMKEYWNGDKQWDKAYEMMKGFHWRDRDTEDISSDNPSDKIVVNITASTILSIGPFIMNGDVMFKCTPRQPQASVNAKLEQEILNYEWKHRDMSAQIKKCRDDALTIGHGIAKTGFTLRVDEGRAKADGDIVYDTDITEESPYIKRVNPKCFLFDPTAPDFSLNTARWCGEIFFVPVIDILANQRYNASVLNDIRLARWQIMTRDSIFGNNKSDYNSDWYNNDLANCPETQLGICYEIFDKKFNKRYVFAAGVLPPLLETDNPYPYLKGEFPYKKLDYITLQNEFYGVGIPYMIQDQQYELNRHRTMAYEHRRRFNRKYWAVENAVEEQEVNQLQDGPDGTIIWVKQANAVGAVEDAPLSQDYERIEVGMKSDIFEITGSDALSRGGNLPSRTTGTEINARSNIFSVKLDDRIDALDKFILGIGKQTLAHIKDNYVTEKIIRIVGAQGVYWVRYNRQDIQDEVDVDMSTVAAPRSDPQMEKQQKIQVMQMIMNPITLQLIQMGLLEGVNFTALFKWILESFDDSKDVGRFFNQALIPNVPLQAISPEQFGMEMQGQSIQQPSNVQDLMKTFSGAANQNPGLQFG